MEYSVIDGKVINAGGNIAIRYSQLTGKLITVGGSEYLFRTQNNICIAWVKPEHVSLILAIKKNCCGNHLGQQFFIASEMDARIWLGMSARP